MSTPDPFDRQFRRTARDMRRRPSPRSWDRIEARLDGRRPGSRILGLRPWIIAAAILLVAGFAALSQLSLHSSATILAQRAESVEELNSDSRPVTRIPDYAPVQEGRTDGALLSRSESRSRLAVSPKYRL